MAEWYLRYLVEPAVRQQKGKMTDTTQFICDVCNVLKPDEHKNWKVPAKFARHIQDKHSDSDDVVLGYLKLNHDDKKHQCPFCMDWWKKKSQAIEHLDNRHHDAYQRILDGEGAVQDMRLARAEEGSMLPERKAKWYTLIRDAEAYEDALQVAQNYANMYELSADVP